MLEIIFVVIISFFVVGLVVWTSLIQVQVSNNEGDKDKVDNLTVDSLLVDQPVRTGNNKELISGNIHIDEVEGLTETLTDLEQPKKQTVIEFTEVGATVTPVTGCLNLFAKLDSQLYIKDSTGTETKLSGGGGGTGDVVGPNLSMNNAIALFDTTTGKKIKNSIVSIDVDGNMLVPATIQMVSDTVPQGTVARSTISGTVSQISFLDHVGGAEGNINTNATRMEITHPSAVRVTQKTEIFPHGVATGETGRLDFFELKANGTESVGFKAPDAVMGTVNWTLPPLDGNADDILSTNGNEILSWIPHGNNLPRCIAVVNVPIPLTSGDNTLIEFKQNLITPEGGMLHSTTINPSRFTVPIDGLYQVNYEAFWAASTVASAQNFQAVIVNGDQFARRFARVVDDSVMNQVDAANGSALIPLLAGDFIELLCSQNTGAILNFSSNSVIEQAELSIYYVGTT